MWRGSWDHDSYIESKSNQNMNPNP
jgi:hypothetical protein